MRVDWVKMIMRAEGTVPVGLSLTIFEGRHVFTSLPELTIGPQRIRKRESFNDAIATSLLMQRFGSFMKTELKFRERAIGAIGIGNQLLVCSRLDHQTAIDYVDSIGFTDRCQSMGDDHRCTPFHQDVESLLDQTLAFRIERAGGLIQNQDGGIAEDRPCDGNALSLSARELDAAFPPPSSNSLRETG